MEFPYARSRQIAGLLLLLAAITQAIYTALYLSEAPVPRQFLWGSEAVIFVLLAAFAGSALVQAGAQQLAWAAITAAAILNVVQVSVGLSMFGPFSEAAGAVEGLRPAARSVVAFSFMVYNAAKVLLALALMVFGAARLKTGGRVLGAASLAIGVVAFASNAASMSAGRGVFGDLPLAGGSGVVATALLAILLLTAPGPGGPIDRT